MTNHKLQRQLDRRSRMQVAVLVTFVGLLPLMVGAYFLKRAVAPVAEEPYVKLFAATFMGIFLEAMPFLLLGSLLAGFIEVFVSPELLLKLTPRRKFTQLLVGACVGVCFPVCECGIVPVVRRLLRKGLPLRMTVAYLLAAPIVNPVVILSTILAFKNSPAALTMPLLRVGVGVSVAMTVGAIVGGMSALRKGFAVENEHANHHQHDHVRDPVRRRIVHVLEHAVKEFFDISRYLMMGAAAAALFQILVPREAIMVMGQTPGLSVFVMMSLAVILNLCSEADAFVAASFTQFSFASKLSFLVLGPMFDIKLLILYFSVFRNRFIVRLVAAILVLVFAVCTLMGVFYSVG